MVACKFYQKGQCQFGGMSLNPIPSSSLICFFPQTSAASNISTRLDKETTADSRATTRPDTTTTNSNTTTMIVSRITTRVGAVSHSRTEALLPAIKGEATTPTAQTQPKIGTSSQMPTTIIKIRAVVNSRAEEGSSRRVEVEVEAEEVLVEAQSIQSQTLSISSAEETTTCSGRTYRMT